MGFEQDHSVRRDDGNSRILCKLCEEKDEEMKASDKLALTYVGSFALMGWWNHRNGLRGEQLMAQTALQGAFLGTGLTVVVFLSSDASRAGAGILQSNPKPSLSGEAVKLLAKINTEKLYAKFKNDKVKIGPSYKQPNQVGTFSSPIPKENKG